MIIDFSVSFKEYKEKIASFYGVWNYVCPACSAKRQWARHATYVRHLLFLEGQGLQDEELTVLRLLCKSCAHTQAILPKECIPFQVYSATLMLQALTVYFQTEQVKADL